jgi:uncharacterized protein
VIFGSGPRCASCRPLLRSPDRAGIGVESMDTPAACRTYNVLASEGPRVVAAAVRAAAAPAR